MMRLLLTVILANACLGAPPADEGPRIERLNRAFLEHVKSLGHEHALAAGIVAANWETYRQQMPDSFVPDALAVLYPAYRAALGAFDDGHHAEAVRLFAPLRQDADPYLAAGARYFHSRALVEQGLLEEAEAELQDVVTAGDDLARYTPYAAHLWFLRAYCQTSNLRFAEATETLHALEQAFPDAAEPVRIGARQLLLEIERRERGTLDEVATIMGYSAARLGATDTTPRLRQHQDEAVALLDKLIQETEQREKQQQGGAGRRASGQQQNRPRSAAEKSELPAPAPGEIGQQHAAAKADPGEMWGRLPPAEREKILQSLRDRFPSRYRLLVEQYYRSLAQEK